MTERKGGQAPCSAIKYAGGFSLPALTLRNEEKEGHLMFFRYLVLSVVALTVLACAEEDTVSYTLTTTVEPVNPLPGVPFSLSVAVMNDDGLPVSNAIVRVAQQDETPLAGDGAILQSIGIGLYGIDTLTVDEVGIYPFKVKVSTHDAKAESLVLVEVTCASEQPEGGLCCDHSKCGVGLWCLENHCSSEPRPVAIPCDDSAQCAQGLWCDSGACSDQARPVGIACSETSQCAANLWCQDTACSDTPRPLGTECSEHDHCENTLWCQDALCSDGIRPTGVPCAEDAACQSVLCLDGQCGDAWAMLGRGNGAPDSVNLALVTSRQLRAPSDLAFSPHADRELWVVNRDGDQLTVIENVGANNQSQLSYRDRQRHFLEEVISLSFGDAVAVDDPGRPGYELPHLGNTFGTCGESRNSYDGNADPNDFMGPTLWPSSAENFRIYGPNAESVHLDMLHSTPLCMGIAGAGGNTYYVFNGLVGNIDWYDFGQPHADIEHGHGGDDHSDGKKKRFTDVEVQREEGVPSHMIYDFESELLYVADTGNHRVISVSFKEARPGVRLLGFPGDGAIYQEVGAQVSVVVEGNRDLVSPSGLALDQGILYVTDHATGFIHAFTLDGTQVNTLDTGVGPGSLSGITVGPDRRIYLTLRSENRVVRIEP